MIEKELVVKLNRVELVVSIYVPMVFVVPPSKWMPASAMPITPFVHTVLAVPARVPVVLPSTELSMNTWLGLFAVFPSVILYSSKSGTGTAVLFVMNWVAKKLL